MISRFCSYIDKAFGLGERMAQLRDARRRPRIPLAAIWGSVFFFFVFRQRSLHAMEGQLHQGRRIEKVIGPREPMLIGWGRYWEWLIPSSCG